jgi:transposase
MNEIGAVIQAAKKLIPKKVQEELIKQLGMSETLDASPAGAVLMGMYILEYVGFPRYIDEQLGMEYTSIEQLRNHYHEKQPDEKPMTPSAGIILSLMVADMFACPRNITRTYKFEEMAEIWKTGPLLGIEPSLLNDDRILRTMSLLGADMQNMKEILFQLVINASKKAGIALNKFILDTTLLQLSGNFDDTPKVVPGRGRDSFDQLVVSLVVASGSKLPVGFNILAGNTSDSSTLPDAYHTINTIADEGSIELIMDRAFPTASNIRFLNEHQEERMVYWVSPLKIGLSEKEARRLINEAYSYKKWNAVSYRSTKEKKSNVEPPLTAFEGIWTLTDVIKPELEPGQKRRAKGSIQSIEMDVRVVFYQHKINAENEKKRRYHEKDQLEKALQDFESKLNKRKLRDIEYCQNKLDGLVKGFKKVGRFLKYEFSKTDNGIISLDIIWDDVAIEQEEKYDGIFALLTNYEKNQINADGLVTKYRSRDEIEVNFKDMKGLLDLEKIIYQIPERIDTYIFLKVIAFFILAFLKTYAENAGLKTTKKGIQESMGDMLIVENKLMPLGMKTYGVARDTALNKLFRKTFLLPEPLDLIKILSEIELTKVNEYVINWYTKRLC